MKPMQPNDSSELLGLLIHLKDNNVQFNYLRMIELTPPSEDTPNVTVWRAFDEQDRPIRDCGKEFDSNRFQRVQFAPGSTVTANNARKMRADIARGVT